MNRSVLWTVLALVGLGILGAGGFTAVQLLSRPDDADLPPGSIVFEEVRDVGSGPIRVRTVIEPSSLLPDRPAEAGGVLTRREDNSLFVGTGDISVNVEVVNGETTVVADHSGPELEVVVDRETVFYEDITEVPQDFTEDKEIRLEQQLREADLPQDLSAGGNIQAWGERRGDRIIATIVVFGELN